MPTIYSSSPAPWKAGGSQVEQWESGLIRVTQDYMVPREQRETFASTTFKRGNELTDIDSPAMDGLYIYPDPTIADMGNGLAKITVTAYGRKEGAYSAEMNYIIEGISANGVTASLYNGEVVPNPIEGTFYLPQYKIQWVSIQGEFPTPDFLEELKQRDPIYTVGFNGEGVLYPAGRAYSFDTQPSSSFGRFNEQVLTMTVYPSGTTI